MSHFNILPDELLQRIFEFVPNEHRYVAAVDRRFRNAYPSKITTPGSAVQSIARLQICMTECGDGFEKRNIVRATFGVGSRELLQCMVDEGHFLSRAYMSDAFCVAAWNGRIHVLERGWGNGCIPLSASLCVAAAKGGQLATLQWLRAHNCPWTVTAYGAAVTGGHLHILKWLWANNCPWDRSRASNYCVYAAVYNHLSILKWLRAKGCHLDWFIFSTAARCGSIDMVRWLKANDCPWQEDACSCSAENGRLDVLVFLRDNGCPWNKEVCARAAKKGHLDVLVWAIENGCPFDKSDCISLARGSDHTAVTAWLTAREE